jgi:hypothetical protein
MEGGATVRMAVGSTVRLLAYIAITLTTQRAEKVLAEEHERDKKHPDRIELPE